MKETKLDSLLQRCCKSSTVATATERVRDTQQQQVRQQPGSSHPNNHFSCTSHTNHQRTATQRPIHSPSTRIPTQSVSSSLHSPNYSNKSLLNFFNYFILFVIMCLLQSASATIPSRCLQEFTHFDCGTQLERRWTYDSVDMVCKDNIEWPCQPYDDTVNSFGSEQECNSVCRSHIVGQTPSGEADPVTIAPIASSEGPTLASIEVCFEPPRQMFCEDFFPPVTHYFYNHETDECESFSFFNCNSFGNNFESLETCIATCRDRLRATTERPTGGAMTTQPAGPECILSQPPPTCNGSQSMECYHYNPESGQCESFRALTCDGSFSSEASCVATCSSSSSSGTTMLATTTTDDELTTREQLSDTPTSHVTTSLDHVTTSSEHVTSPTAILPTTEDVDGTHISSKPNLSLLDFASIVLAVLALGLVILLIVVVGVVKYKYRRAVKKHAQEMIEIKRKSITSFTDKHRHHHHGNRHSQTKTASSRTNDYGDIV